MPVRPTTQDEALRDSLETKLTARWAGWLVDSFHGNLTVPGRGHRRLSQRLRPGLGVYDAYYEGDHELGFATHAYWEAFGPYLGATADNFMPLVVNARVQRLKVQGFRFGRATSADQDAWDIWQASGMDVGSDKLHRESLKLRVAYWLVDPPRTDGDSPTITPEHPSQMIVLCSPANPRIRLAAFKKWYGNDGWIYANLYTPAAVFKWRKPGALLYSSVALPPGVRADEWQLDEAASGEHALGEVPVIPAPNMPRMDGVGVSVLKDVIGDQTNINKMLADMMLGSEYQAFPQRVLLGVQALTDHAGNPITAADLQASRSRLWRFGDKDAKVDQFDPADLENYVKARNHLLDGLFSKASIPINYNARGQLSNLSADALKAAEKNLIMSVEDSIPGFEDAHEDTMRLAFKSIGDEQKATEMRAEVIWRSRESKTEAELTDAGQKKLAMGIPLEIVLEDMGKSPTEIDRIMALKQADELFAPPAPAAPGAPASSNGQVPAAA